MREFKNFAEFSAYFQTLIGRQKEVLEQGLTVAAEIVEKEAKDEFGFYQRSNMGPFEAWDELADYTKAERIAKEFSENEPLYRTGGLRDSISKEVEGYKAVIGSDDDIMVYQELGTVRIPPRPVLGTAAFRKKKAVANAIKESLIGLLTGNELIRRSYKEE